MANHPLRRGDWSRYPIEERERLWPLESVEIS